jgi:hypothetical protein
MRRWNFLDREISARVSPLFMATFCGDAEMRRWFSGFTAFSTVPDLLPLLALRTGKTMPPSLGETVGLDRPWRSSGKQRT